MNISATNVMKLIGAKPRLLGLGEPTHGEDVLLEVRNDLFRELVEQEGFRAIAIESDCLAGTVVDDYVTLGEGTLDDVMARGFSHGLGVSRANRELVRWMRDHNDGRPAGERLRFAGADGPLEITGPDSPRDVVIALHGYLARWLDPRLLPCTTETLGDLLGDDGRWTNPDTMMDPAQSIGQSAEARELRVLADDLAALVEAEAPHLIAASSREGWDRGRLYARTATGLLRYHFWMADPGPLRVDRLLGVRDAMMAANLLAAAEWGPVLVYTHNAHLQRHRSSLTMWGDLRPEWWSAGALVDARLGDGFRHLAMAVGTIRHHGVDTPPPDTIEGRLYAEPAGLLLADSHGLTGRAARVSTWFGYSALDPAFVSGLDGVVFVKDCPAP
ncbi:erythromycin esterase family protein [Actinoplanes sp. NPDC089786]|uniref:erythromycin esterase family protein n=1 Tax=Actinoplanes sp. NPDC089786 TaxID=3155185 RepID=UPI00341B5924